MTTSTTTPSVPVAATALGGLLVVVGVVAYATSGPDASPTALIPALLGAALAIAGLVALRVGGARHHAMHAAAVVALLGALGSAGQLITRPAAGSDDAGTATVAGAITLVVCVVFLALAIRSFRAARRARA